MPEQLELQQLVDLSVGSQDETLPNLDENKRPLLKRVPYLGLLLAALSSFFFSLCSVTVKVLVTITPNELAIFRFAGILLPTIPILIYTEKPVFPEGKRFLLISRSILGALGLITSFMAFRLMPLAEASIIVFSVPVFVAIFARIFLKEPCSIWNTISIILTLIGVVLITRPSFLFNNDPLTDSEVNYNMLRGAAAAFLSTILGANAYVILRLLKDLHYSVIMTNFGAVAMFMSFMFSYIHESLCMPACGINRWLVVLLGLFSFIGQILLTLALQIEDAGPVAIARSADIVFAFIWQFIFFSETPNRYSVFGAILIVSSIVLVGLRKWVLVLPETSFLRRKFGVLVQ